MTDSPPPLPPKTAEQQARALREAAALRENLRRRKEQARARDPLPPAPEQPPK